MKENYSAIVVTLNNIYDQTDEPEALGLCKVLSKVTNLSAIFLLDFSLPLIAKLSKSPQSEKLGLTSISSLVDATIHNLDDALYPAANWVLILLEVREESEKAIGLQVTLVAITFFHDKVAKPFINDLKNNIMSLFRSQDVVSSFSIFDFQ